MEVLIDSFDVRDVFGGSWRQEGRLWRVRRETVGVVDGGWMFGRPSRI